MHLKGTSKGSPYWIAKHRVPEMIPALGSQPAGDVSHKPGGRLSLLSTMPAVTFPACRLLPVSVLGEQIGTLGVNSLPKTVIRQHHGCDLNPGPSVPESSTLTTRLPSHPNDMISAISLISYFLVFEVDVTATVKSYQLCALRC